MELAKTVVEEMLTSCLPQGAWYLVRGEPEFKSSSVLEMSGYRNPFARIIAKGYECSAKVAKLEVGDLVIYVEGVNVSELKGLTNNAKMGYFFVHENKMLGKVPETENYRDVMPKKVDTADSPFKR